jgi:hypothetical protein
MCETLLNMEYVGTIMGYSIRQEILPYLNDVKIAFLSLNYHVHVLAWTVYAFVVRREILLDFRGDFNFFDLSYPNTGYLYLAYF